MIAVPDYWEEWTTRATSDMWSTTAVTWTTTATSTTSDFWSNQPYTVETSGRAEIPRKIPQRTPYLYRRPKRPPVLRRRFALRGAATLRGQRC